MPRVVDQRPRSVADKDPLRGLLDFQDLDKTIEDSGNRIRGALNKVRDDFIEWLRDVTGIDLSGALEFTDWLFEEIRSRVGVDLENLAALLEDLGDLDLASLLDAVRGDYDGDNSVLLGIQSSIGALRSLAAGIIAPWRIPQLTLSQLTALPSPNLLTGFGDFAAGSTLDGDGVWTWDGAVGKTTPGSARTTADGTLKVLTSEAIAVAAGQQLECSGWVRWQGASGSGPCMQLLVVPYIGAAAQTPVVISNIVAPPGTVGVSSESTLAGSYVVAANVTAVRVRLTIEAAMTAGTVWWDDVVLRKVATSLPQQWISGLVDGLGDLWDGVENVATIITQISDIFAGAVVTPINAAVAKVKDWFFGLLGWQDNTTSTAETIAESVVTVGTQVHYVQEMIAYRSGRPAHETGPDRTACVSFPFSDLNLAAANVAVSGGSHSVDVSGNTGFTIAGGDNHRHSATGLSGSAPNHAHTVTMGAPVVNATATYAPWGNVIFDTAAERKVLTWMAYKSGQVLSFHLDVYKLEADGSTTFTGYTSPDYAGELTETLAFMRDLMTGISILADEGDSYEVQFRMTGTGQVRIAGVNQLNPTPLPGLRPYAQGAGRNPSTTPTPATISTAARDAMYTGPTPWIAIGIDIGQANLPRVITDDYNRASIGPRWKAFGNIGIVDGKVQNTGSVFVSTSGALMHVQPLAYDQTEMSFDLIVGHGETGGGVGCTSDLSSGVWLVADENGVYIQTGAYNARTTRASGPASGSGRFFMTCTLESGVWIYRAFKGSTDTPPIAVWTDNTNIAGHGIGRRFVANVARRVFVDPSGRLDNFAAVDLTAAA